MEHLVLLRRGDFVLLLSNLRLYRRLWYWHCLYLRLAQQADQIIYHALEHAFGDRADKSGQSHLAAKRPFQPCFDADDAIDIPQLDKTAVQSPAPFLSSIHILPCTAPC